MLKKIVFLLVTMNILGLYPILSTPSQKISSPFSQAKFVPNISAILDFSYHFRNLSDNDYLSMPLSGITLGNDEFSARGFNLNYFELAIEAVVDPFFDLFSAFHIQGEEFAIEEAYIKTRSLPAGMQLKVGKFLSSFGRLNSQHDHVWNFSDQPLIYHALFGDGNLNEQGIQLNWVAPTSLFIKLGMELFQGDNEYSFKNKDFTLNNQVQQKTDSPLVVLFGKNSFDLGNWVVLWGISWARGDINKLYETKDFGIVGTTSLTGIDLTIKYQIDSYRYFNLQTEYLYRIIDGSQYFESSESLDTQNKHSGFYTELTYRFNRRWRSGLRYDQILKNDDLFQDLAIQENYIPDIQNKISAMLEFNPSEFSRIRIQYNLNRAKTLNNQEKDIHELFIHFNMAIGAHGAHKF